MAKQNFSVEFSKFLKDGGSLANITPLLTEFFVEYGYLETNDSDDGSPTPIVDIEATLRQFQYANDLPITGDADQATLSLMAKPRCGNSDHIGANPLFFSGKWPKKNLTYCITGYSKDLSNAEQDSAMRAAFDLWEDACGLSFKVTKEDKADIKIFFASGEHGDGNDFDGQSGVLAHAYFPTQPINSISGDAHFDEDESWTVEIPIPANGIDLVTVAAHEFGHSIGLGHTTKVRGALMYPYYGGAQRYLHQDDKRRAQALYGEN